MRQFSESEKQWLIDHYETMKQCDCAHRLNCSENVIRRLAKELGVYKSRKIYEKSKMVKVTIAEEGEGYCLD